MGTYFYWGWKHVFIGGMGGNLWGDESHHPPWICTPATSSFTCFKPNGCSAVNYFAVSHFQGVTLDVKLFEVLPLILFTDHRPAKLTLHVDNNYYHIANQFMNKSLVKNKEHIKLEPSFPK